MQHLHVLVAHQQRLGLRAEAGSYLTVEAWARLGLGGAIMPASRFRDDKATRPLYDQGQPITIGYEAVWLTRSSREAAIHNVLDTIAR